MEPDSAAVVPLVSQQPDPATLTTMHWGAGVPDGEGVGVGVTEGVAEGVVERDAVVVAVGDAEVDAPTDFEAENGVAVGDRELVEESVEGALKTTVAIAPLEGTLLSDQK